jgi:hypothetical protein
MKATWDNLKPGTRVRCIRTDAKKFGYTGVIDKDTLRGAYISVIWDDDTPSGLWSYPSSFEVLSDDNFPKSPSLEEAYGGGAIANEQRATLEA